MTSICQIVFIREIVCACCCRNHIMRVELRAQLADLRPKEEAVVSRTRAVKRAVEALLSTQYDGRPVNIIGEINNLL